MNHPIPFSRSVLLLSFVTLLSVSDRAWTVVVSNTGTSGLPGVDVAEGIPGGDGGAAADSIAIAVANEQVNTATATGSEGGRGGQSGSGITGVNGNKGGKGGAGGNATAVASQSTPDNIQAGNASVTAIAQGGKGGALGLGGVVSGFLEMGDGANGGNATASASVRATGNVNVIASSIAGDGSGITGIVTGSITKPLAPTVMGNGGMAALGKVYGESINDGIVIVTGTAQGGNGGGALRNGDASNMSDSGSGADVSLFNAIDGKTTGDLTLSQNAIGGAAGSTAGGNVGNAGFAWSILSKRSSNRSLTLSTSAIGGKSGGRGLRGATGRSVTVGTNELGSVDISAKAQGGDGGVTRYDLNSAVGGVALSYVVGRTSVGGQNVKLNSAATGGEGGSLSIRAVGNTAGDGGLAISVAKGFAIGSSQIIGEISAVGGRGGSVNSFRGSGGNGGEARAELNGNLLGTGLSNGTTRGAFFLSSRATGGDGGQGRGAGESGGAGGSATGLANVSITTSDNLAIEKSTIKMEQIGGSGGGGINSADGGAGADSFMKDGFNITTKGEIDLNQNASGGNGGSSDGGLVGFAGNGSSSLTLLDQYGKAAVFAGGGGGGNGSNGSDGGKGGGATSDIVSLSTRDFNDIDIRAKANGGRGGSVTSGGGNAGNGGSAKLGRVFADSTTGGAIFVMGTVVGGEGGLSLGNGNAGNGFSANLTNAVDGETSGDLFLKQVAVGGASGNVTNGLNGVAGNASSLLNKSTRSDSLFLNVDARAGSGGNRFSSNGVAANGGRAQTVVSGVNDAGWTGARGVAYGGNGGAGTGGAGGGVGGDANSFVIARGLLLDRDETSPGLVCCSLEIRGKNINASGKAFGGDGGSINAVGRAGKGGNAISIVRARSTENMSGFFGVEARSFAVGGKGGTVLGDGIGARGGNAEANSMSLSQAESTAISSSAGGLGSGKQKSGNARSFSEATGTSGKSIAVAAIGKWNDRNFASASSFASIAGDSANGVVATSKSLAIAVTGEAIFDREQFQGLQAGTYVSLLPTAVDVATLIKGNNNIETAMLEKEALVTGFLSGSFSGATYDNIVDFNIDMDDKVGSDLLVGLFNSTATGDHGFDSLLFKITIEDVEVENMIFSNAAAAEIYFNDNALNFGLWEELISADNVLDLKLSLDLTEQHVGQGFSINLIAGTGIVNNLIVAPKLAAATVVPIPATVWLFGSGLLGLFSIMRRGTAGILFSRFIAK